MPVRCMVMMPLVIISRRDCSETRKGIIINGSSIFERDLHWHEAYAEPYRGHHQRYGADCARCLPLDNLPVTGRACLSNEHVVRGVCCDCYRPLYSDRLCHAGQTLPLSRRRQVL